MTGSILLAAALQAAQPAYGPLDWLAGDWACRERIRIGPAWRVFRLERDGHGLTGSFGRERTTAGPREKVTEGRLRIAGEGSATRLSFMPANARAIRYRLVRSDHDRSALGTPVAVFETRANVPAQHIVFRRSPFRLVVTTSRLDGSGAETTSYSPPGLHTGVGACDGSR